MKLNADTTEAEEKEKDCHVYGRMILTIVHAALSELPFLLDKISTKLTFRISVQRLLPRDAVSGDLASVDLWIFGSANSEGKTGQPEKAAHRPWFRPTAQQCSDWTFAHLTNQYKLCIQLLNIHVSTYDI